MNAGRPVQRVTTRLVATLADGASPRDWQILENVEKVRLLTGGQLERLCFHELAGRSRAVVRWRALKRLTDWRAVLPLPRRIGGQARGSAGTTYALGSAGYALLQLRRNERGDAAPRRRPGPPGERFVRHVLAVSELYVQLVEAHRAGRLHLLDFQAEPACWWPDGLGGQLKPDAYVLLASEKYEDAWWIETDMATEHIPTLRRKMETYLDFIQRGQLGPQNIMPRVLVSVTTGARKEAVVTMLRSLPPPAENLLHVATQAETVAYLVQRLRE